MPQLLGRIDDLETGWSTAETIPPDKYVVGISLIL
jgi:hypothetical protein